MTDALCGGGLYRKVPAPPRSLFCELPMYALAAILEQEVLKELDVVSWEKVPAGKSQEKKKGKTTTKSYAFTSNNTRYLPTCITLDQYQST